MATGFAKWGMTGGTAAAMILSDRVLGRENPWAGLFNPNRVKPRAARHVRRGEREGRAALRRRPPDQARHAADRGPRARRGRHRAPRRREGRRPPPRRRHARRRLPALHPPRLPGQLEHRRAQLGLPVPRLALQPRGRGAPRARPCTGWRPSRSNRARPGMRILLLALVLLALALLPASAQAAPPANDNRVTAATPLSLPAAPTATTSESTLEQDEPSSCAELRGSVWYAVQAPARRTIVVRLAAAGDLDAVVDVFQRTRSQLSPVSCDVGNARGQAETEFRSTRGGSYLIRVGQRVNSVPGALPARRLRAPAPAAAARAGAARRRGDAQRQCHRQHERRLLDRHARGHHLPRAPRPGAGLHRARALRARDVRLRRRLAGQAGGLRRLLPVHPGRRRGRALLAAGDRAGTPARRPALPPAGRQGHRGRHLARPAARQLRARTRKPAGVRRRRRRHLPLLARAPQPAAREPARQRASSCSCCATPATASPRATTA